MMEDVSPAIHDAPAAPEPKKRSHYGWLWIFGLLFVASVGVAVFMIQFNLSQLLTREKFEAARGTWRNNGPKNYILVYTKKLNDQRQTIQFIVKVKAGEVKEVVMDGIPLEAESRGYHTMDALYRDIEKFMDYDANVLKRKTFTTARFDEKTGAIRQYIRRVPNTTNRVEINAKMEEWTD